MELVGTEKRIQALFRELKLADESSASEFTEVWHRAQLVRSGRSRALMLSFALTSAMFLIGFVVLLLWSRNAELSPATVSAVAGVSVQPGAMSSSPPAHPGTTRPSAAPRTLRARSRSSHPKALSHDTLDLKAKSMTVMREVLAISSWRSPTATLLQSPAGYVLTSLPEFDRSLNELKTFLPLLGQ
jgi:hypothetical protein